MTNNIHNNLLQNLQNAIIPGTVFLASWLEQMNISRNLQQYYKRSGWIDSIGAGAFTRPSDLVGWIGGIYAIQNHAKLPIYPGGLTALSLKGSAHYLRNSNEIIHLMGEDNAILPKWFKNHNWGHSVNYCATSFLPANIGLIKYKELNFSINISSNERAILECLYLAPNKIDLIEIYQIIEGLVNLRPDLLQILLEQCSSIKVKRLFLYMANKSKHSWVKYIDKTKINLGKGARNITRGGIYIPDYQITIPTKLALEL